MEVTGKTRKPPPLNHHDVQDNCAKLSHAGADTDGHVRVRCIRVLVWFSFLSDALVTV